MCSSELKEGLQKAPVYAYMDGVAQVVRSVKEAKAALQTMHDIGGVPSFVINTRKTKVHHRRSQPPMESFNFHKVTVPVLLAVAQYLGHVLAHKSLCLIVEQDIVQTIAVHVKSYEDLPLMV